MNNKKILKLLLFYIILLITYFVLAIIVITKDVNLPWAASFFYILGSLHAHIQNHILGGVK